MISVYHGRLAPSLELSHHQFLSAFKKVFFRSPIIGRTLESVKALVKKKYFLTNPEKVSSRQKCALIPAVQAANWIHWYILPGNATFLFVGWLKKCQTNLQSIKFE
jgi:glutamine amidotransferase PdxT